VTDGNLSEIFTQAAEIAKLVPESMQEAAFNRALDELLPGQSSRQQKTRRKTSRRKTTSKATSGGEGESQKTSAKPRRSSSGRPGPKAALEQLIDEGFFATPKTLNGIQTDLQKRRGYKYEASDLGPTLLRLLRESRLSREKNAEGQYEYSAV
jgi:hypothetical protein